MNSPTITMDKDAAVRKLEEYEQAARANPRAMRDIDKGLVAGYRALAKGKRLVDVNEALKAAGVNLAGQPKLAIARAHVEACSWKPTMTGRWEGDKHVGWTGDGGGEFYYGSWGQRVTDDRTRWFLPAGFFAAGTLYTSRTSREFKAFAPLIPMPLRPKHDLRGYFLLWEANWHPEPPRDPYLLKPLAGSLMEIVAEWDLTPLEIAAVRGATR